MTYDVENRLTQVITGGVTYDYVYDPNGKLFQKKEAGAVVEQYLTDGNELIADYNGSGSLVRRYVYGANIDERLAYYPTSTMNSPQYYLSDYQGSVIGLSDATSYASYGGYGPFGETSGASDQPFRYTGRRFDSDTGLYYYRARWYSPELGRFLQTDPIGYEDNMHMYAYVSNDPLNNTDPSGEAKCTITTESVEVDGEQRSLSKVHCIEEDDDGNQTVTYARSFVDWSEDEIEIAQDFLDSCEALGCTSPEGEEGNQVRGDIAELMGEATGLIDPGPDFGRVGVKTWKSLTTKPTTTKSVRGNPKGTLASGLTQNSPRNAQVRRINPQRRAKKNQ